MKLNKKKIWIWVIIIALIILAVWYFKFAKHYPNNIDLSQTKENYWAVTFSPKFCDELGLDWKEVYSAILNDLRVKNIRLPFYWDQIEVEDGEFDFMVYDFILDEGSKRGVKFIANIGWRLPRWPECHAPEWVEEKGVDYTKSKTFDILRTVVERYKDCKEIIMWQVENEPLLNVFGLCPKGDYEFLKKEVALVRSLDKRPILISASGELSTWRREAQLADVFATTMYRVVWSPWFGYFRYPYPSWIYNFKANLLGLKEGEIMISELQAEPWVPRGTLADIKPTELNKSFDMDQFKANLQYAINADLNRAYLWGVEWWYLRKINGDASYWELAKSLFK